MLFKSTQFGRCIMWWDSSANWGFGSDALRASLQGSRLSAKTILLLMTLKSHPSPG